MPERINRKEKKAEARTLLAGAQVSARSMTCFYLLLLFLTNLLVDMTPGTGLFVQFLTILGQLVTLILGAGFTLYIMAVRRGESQTYTDIFNGFSLAGKLVLLAVVQFALILFGLYLFFVPGILLFYRYRFAYFDLFEDPSMNPLNALRMSAQQTRGYKLQLFALDMSYLPWLLLAYGPDLFFSFCILYPSTPGAELLQSIPAVLALNVFSLVVMLFYLPAYRCTELAYFEVAKRTSGVGFGAEPPAPQSPDGLGGWN